MATKKIVPFAILSFVLLECFSFHSFGQEKIQVVAIDSLVRPPIERIEIIPLWVKQIDDNIFFPNWATIRNKILVSNSQTILIDIKTGKPIDATDQRIRENETSALVTHSDSILLINLTTQHKVFMSLGRNAQRPILSEDHDTTVVFVNGSTIFTYHKILKKNVPIFTDRKIVFDNVISVANELVATGQYSDRTSDSTTNFCIRLNPTNGVTVLYTNKAPIYEIKFFNGHLYAFTRDDLTIVNTSSWKVISIVKFTRPQKFVFIDGRFSSPNLTFDPSMQRFISTSKYQWDSRTIALWNDWRVLNFDDHEVTRNYLVNRDHSKIFELDLHRDNFLPCELEAFGDTALLEFIDSTEEYTVAACKCDNGLFLYGLKFPDTLPSDN